MSSFDVSPRRPGVKREFFDPLTGSTFTGGVYKWRRSGLIHASMARRRVARARPRYRRRRRFKRRVTRAVQPYSIVRKLKTVRQFDLNCGAGSIYVETVKLNAGDDPTGTLGSLQPLGWDQYAALYQRACVIGWDVKVEACSTDNTNAIVVGFAPMVESSGLTQYEHYKEQAACVSRIMTPDIDKIVFGSRGSVKRWLLPQGGRMLSDANLAGGVTTTDPNKVLYGHLFAQAMDNSADPAVVHCIVTITQIVAFFQPIVPSRST